VNGEFDAAPMLVAFASLFVLIAWLAGGCG